MNNFLALFNELPVGGCAPPGRQGRQAEQAKVGLLTPATTWRAAETRSATSMHRARGRFERNLPGQQACGDETIRAPGLRGLSAKTDTLQTQIKPSTGADPPPRRRRQPAGHAGQLIGLL